ncbi:sensor histidine kinase [Bacillus solitudinis]|uniref:sensor histidine kinase n=1 Tax=Bacillus solitudinis TaxID=2014074 RepID=UPI000C2395CA|nr:sensor histidine kinase [Bacillus solitudinis]
MKTMRESFMKYFLLRDQFLMTKMLVFFSVLVVMPILLVSYFSYHYSSKMLEEEARQYSFQIIGQVQIYIEDYLRDLEVDTLKMINHPDTVDFLRMGINQEVEESEVRRRVQNVLKNVSYSRSDITNITLILDDLHMISSNERDIHEAVLTFREENWFQTIPTNGKSQIISRVVDTNGKKDPYLFIVKKLVNPHSLAPYGMLVMEVNYRRLHDVAAKNRRGAAGYLVIVDNQGRYVYHPDVANIGQEPTNHEIKDLINSESGSFLTTERKKHFITYANSDFLDWHFARVVPYQELTRGMNYIKKLTLFVTLTSIIFGFIIAIILVTSVVKPIQSLNKLMKKVEIGDLSVRAKITSTDDIGRLTLGFNKMVRRLAILVNDMYIAKLKETQMDLRQKETELKMLQSQINPHFLYNSLDTIRGMAFYEENEDIANMSGSLAKLLRYNIKGDFKTVPFKHEIEIVELYLSIQRYRFDERLIYTSDIPEWVKEQQIPKFSLQPLIENALAYGTEINTGITRVQIDVEQLNGGSFEILIRDTGPGIDEEKLVKLKALLAIDNQELNTNHIGLMNVHRRIRQHFGEQYGLRLSSKIGKGTTVSIILPITRN